MSQPNNVIATLNATENAVVNALNRVADAASQIGHSIPAAQQRAAESLSSATERIKAGVECLSRLAADTVEDCNDILAGLDGLLASVLAVEPAPLALPEPVATLPLPPAAEPEMVSKAANSPVEASKPAETTRSKLTWTRLSEGILDALDGTYRVERTGDGWTAYHGGTVLGTFSHHNTAKKAASDHANAG